MKNETRIGAEVCSINLEAIGMADGAEVPLQLSSNDGGEKEKNFFFFFLVSVQPKSLDGVKVYNEYLKIENSRTSGAPVHVDVTG